MSKHNELRDRINELCPELMKLEFGCEVESHYHDTSFIQTILAVKDSGNYLVRTGVGEVTTTITRKDIVKILGKDPTLEDVMMAIEKSNKQRGWFVNTNGEFSSVGYENLMTPPKISCKWITGKPLSSQSSETVEKILEILK
jgi:hypothetical protein